MSIDDRSVEQVFVRMDIGRSSLIFGAVYVPPASEMDIYVRHSSTVETVCASHPSSKLVLFGDYNLPDARWNNDDVGVIVEAPSNSPALFISESFGYLALFQKNKLPNERGVFLDLLFSHINSLDVKPAIDLLVPNSVHHKGYYFEIPTIDLVECIKCDEYYLDFKSADYNVVNDMIFSIPWRDILLSDCLDERLNIFYNCISYVMYMFIPLKRSTS